LPVPSAASWRCCPLTGNLIFRFFNEPVDLIEQFRDALNFVDNNKPGESLASMIASKSCGAADNLYAARVQRSIMVAESD